MKFSRTGVLSAVLTGVLMWQAMPSRVVAQTQPAWHAVPKDAVLAVRMPDGQAFADAIRAQTKLGKVVFTDERARKFQELILDIDKNKGGELAEQMQRLGFEPDDFVKMFAGETGMALVLRDFDPKAGPRVGWLAWIEPGEALGEKAMGAIAQLVEDARKDNENIQRVDMELQGQSIMHLMVRDQVTSFVPVEPQAGQPGQAPAFEERNVTMTTHMMVTRMGGRLVMAGLAPRSSRADQQADDASLQVATQLMSEFLTAQKDGADGGFVTKIMAKPGVNALMKPGGITGLEIFADVSPLIAMLAQAEGADAAQIQQILQAWGLDQLDVFAMRMSLKDTLLSSGFFMASPAPRPGIMAILDQPALEPDPPAWVPADVSSYTQISADLGGIFQTIRQVATNAHGQNAAQGFQMIDMMVMAQVQSDIATLLGSLGQKHVMLQYPVHIPENIDDQHQLETMAIQKMALVWQLKDPVPMQNVLNMLSQQMAGNPQGPQVVQEQGFQGIRSNDPNMPSGLFLGQGHMVVGIGDGVSESILSAINNPPKGKDALRNSELWQRASQLIRLEPGLVIQVSDNNQTITTVYQVVREQVLREMANELNDDQLMEKFRAVLPSVEEMKGVFGISAGSMYVTPQGLVQDSVLELPAP